MMTRRLKGGWFAAVLAIASQAGPAAEGAMKRMEVRYVKVDQPAESLGVGGGTTDRSSAPVAGAAPYRRLPSGYGKLGLSDPQRDRIYALRGSYRARIEQLEAELAALKAADAEACESVLTESQKAALERGKKTTSKTAKP